MFIPFNYCFFGCALSNFFSQTCLGSNCFSHALLSTYRTETRPTSFGQTWYQRIILFWLLFWCSRNLTCILTSLLMIILSLLIRNIFHLLPYKQGHCMAFRISVFLYTYQGRISILSIFSFFMSNFLYIHELKYSYKKTCSCY